MSEQPPHAAAWLRQRVAGDAAVAAVERAELRALDAATALRQSELLLAAAPPADPARATTSGLVEQQRLFARARR